LLSHCNASHSECYFAFVLGSSKLSADYPLLSTVHGTTYLTVTSSIHKQYKNNCAFLPIIMVAKAVKVTYKYRVSHGNRTSFKAKNLLPLPVRWDAGSYVTGLMDAILVANGQWTDAQGMFVISRGAIPWPACSSDLSVSDYFIWGYRESKVYLIKPRHWRA
jgi:hypothetical protein